MRRPSSVDTQCILQYARPPETPKEPEATPEVDQYISKSVLRDFSKTVQKILNAWHFPEATDVYFDETNRDVVIGGRLRGEPRCWPVRYHVLRVYACHL
jgi:hypothetical protein